MPRVGLYIRQRGAIEVSIFAALMKKTIFLFPCNSGGEAKRGYGLFFVVLEIGRKHISFPCSGDVYN